MGELCLLLEIPFYLRGPLLRLLGRGQEEGVSCRKFLSSWQANARFLENVIPAEKSFNILCWNHSKSNSNDQRYIPESELAAVARDILSSHPSLHFFRQEKDERLLESYIQTVVVSLQFAAEAWRHRRIYFHQFRKLNLMYILDEVYAARDINTVELFSYNQFYVLYVKFMALDRDGDFCLVPADLKDFADADCLTKRMVERIFAVNLETSFMGKKTVCGGNSSSIDGGPVGKMTFRDWVVFAKAKIGGIGGDPETGAAVEYWFRVLDLDGDGFVSLADFHTFYVDTVVILIQVESQMRDEQHWYRQLDGNPQHKTYVSTTPLPGVLDTIHQVSQVSKYPFKSPGGGESASFFPAAHQGGEARLLTATQTQHIKKPILISDKTQGVTKT